MSDTPKLTVSAKGGDAMTAAVLAAAALTALKKRASLSAAKDAG